MIELDSLRYNLKIDSDAYQRDGFVIVNDANHDLEKLGSEVDRLHLDFDELKISEPALKKLGEWRIKHPHLVSWHIRNYFFSDTFRQICAALVGLDVDFYWATTASKPPIKGKSFP